MGERLTIRCPDCETELIVDSETGAILHHKAAKAPIGGGKSFDDLFSEMDQQKERAENLFEQEKAAFEDRDRLMEEKFEEALKRAEEEPDEKPPLRPFDLD